MVLYYGIYRSQIFLYWYIFVRKKSRMLLLPHLVNWLHKTIKCAHLDISLENSFVLFVIKFMFCEYIYCIIQYYYSVNKRCYIKTW